MAGQTPWAKQTLTNVIKPLYLTPCLLLAMSLTACQKPAQSTQANLASASNSQANVPASTVTQTAVNPASSSQASSVQGAASQAPSQSATAKNPITINWTLIDSGVKPVDKEQFNYPFALDGVQVKAYMDAYHVDAKTARYNLTVGMAVNEVLSKVLDQIGSAYVSHELTTGNPSQFIIHTTKSVRPSEHVYVFEEPFAHGLSMPIVIRDDGNKQTQTQNQAHPALN